ncbi:hypothetical protein [Salinicola peritrichatus]|uniref:hypothetical protein n=1 Tax=Salinicola peritrichatus TaxID=1267424 RepID=UPI000DA25E6B|nr:hypothetical protein [Salinicola peritrichatus]
MSNHAGVDALAETIRSRIGPIFVLMNNAGIIGGCDALPNPTLWDDVIGVRSRVGMPISRQHSMLSCKAKFGDSEMGYVEDMHEQSS